ncbi:MAG: IS66 family transposase [ANME-2 cluster archaeon]|nr:IS66 family transposase [ANME-2 cluster archaeon]
MERDEILAVYEAGPEVVITLIAEQQKIIEQQAARIAVLEERVKLLEEQLNKNSRNSSKPPSTDVFIHEKPKPKSRRKKSGKKAGGQEGHPGTTLTMVDNPDETISHKVHRCDTCDLFLEDVETTNFEKRQVFDIPPVAIKVTEHCAEIKTCPNCGCTNKADFPEEIKHPTQYGPRLAALAVYLHDYQLIPYERCCELLSDVCGCEISPATLIRAEEVCFEKLQGFENEIKNLLKQSYVINCDETGMRINGMRNWLHVASTDKMTYYFAHPKKGSEAIDDMGILPGFIGIAVHDFWKPYYKYNCEHSLCNGHHLRDLTGICENYNQQWSKEIGDLLIDIKNCVDEAREISDNLKAEEIINFEERYDQIIKIGMEENPPPLAPQTLPKKRGRKKQTKAKNLLDRFMDYKSDILRFMNDFEVPFENNQAERDVRVMKLQQKISGTFRSTQGARSFCRIRRYISTVKKNQLSVIDAIQDAFAGKPFVPTPT